MIFLITFRAGLHDQMDIQYGLRGFKPVPFLCFCCLNALRVHVNASWKELCGFSLNQNTPIWMLQQRTTVSEFSNSHWRHQGWQGHSFCLVRRMHAHTLTHRCSLFSQAAINLHARGYESVEGRKRETESQIGLFKVNRGEQVSFSGQIYWTGSRPQLSHAWVGQVMGRWGGGV